MKRSWISKGLALVLPLVPIFLLLDHGVGAARRASKQTESSTRAVALPQQLSSDGQASLRRIIQSGNLSGLRTAASTPTQKILFRAVTVPGHEAIFGDSTKNWGDG